MARCIAAAIVRSDTGRKIDPKCYLHLDKLTCRTCATVPDWVPHSSCPGYLIRGFVMTLAMSGGGIRDTDTMLCPLCPGIRQGDSIYNRIISQNKTIKHKNDLWSDLGFSPGWCWPLMGLSTAFCLYSRTIFGRFRSCFSFAVTFITLSKTCDFLFKSWSYFFCSASCRSKSGRKSTFVTS